MRRANQRRLRFGIGEWYGRPFVRLSSVERRELAELQLLAPNQRPTQPCPFLSRDEHIVACWKRGGVCSLRKYEVDAASGAVAVAHSEGGLRTTCPSRFEQSGQVYRWIGETLLENPEAVAIGQVNFLQRMPLMGSAEDIPSAEEVGRIDNILVTPDSNPLQWCAVEMQAVYFSGTSMEREFEALARSDEVLPFPAAHRRPDYRSSGPKRLMPQLQIKVPTLRRWGKKMAVVVDEYFFSALGRMRRATEISNCDVAWFIVAYDEAYRLGASEVYLTTLEESVEGLVAARPVSLAEFEHRILTKYSRLGSGPVEIPSDD